MTTKDGWIRIHTIDLIREVNILLMGGIEKVVGDRTDECPTCCLGSAGTLREVLHVLHKRLGLDHPVITPEDLAPKGLLGTMGEVARVTRAAANSAAYGLAYSVREFHWKFGHKVRSRPTVPPDAEVRQRLRLHAEEFLEQLEACGLNPDEAFHDRDETRQPSIRAQLQLMIDTDALQVDLPAFVDALGDMDYITEGSRAVFGIDGVPIANAIHECNMQKIAVLDADGNPDPLAKPLKPAGWAPPSVAEILDGQGHRAMQEIERLRANEEA